MRGIYTTRRKTGIAVYIDYQPPDEARDTPNSCGRGCVCLRAEGAAQPRPPGPYGER